MSIAPKLETRNCTTIIASWREWENPPDRETGPVVGYVVYYKAISESDWSAVSVMANLSAESEIGNRSATVTDCLEMTTYE